MIKEATTETKIMEAATRVFIMKGFNGCSSREIAREAGLNVALVNYHFKSKSNLFDLVIGSVLKGFTLSILDIMKSTMSLESKMRILIEKEYDFLSQHPDVPGFIISELGKKDKSFFDCFDLRNQFIETGIFEQVEDAQKSGELRDLDLVSMMLLIMSNCHFPFMAKPMVQTMYSLEDEQYSEKLILHKQYVVDMLINYLFLKK